MTIPRMDIGQCTCRRMFVRADFSLFAAVAMSKTESSKQLQPDIEEVLGLGQSATSTLFQKWRKQISAGAVISVLIVFYLLWTMGGSSSVAQFVTAPVSRGKLTVIVTATGTVQPTNQVAVPSELSGATRKVLVDYNSKVKIGQLLAELDTD